MKRMIRMALWNWMAALAAGLETVRTLGASRPVPPHAAPLLDDAHTVTGNSWGDWESIWGNWRQVGDDFRSAMEQALSGDPAYESHVLSIRPGWAERKRFNRSLRELHELLKDSDGVRSSVPGWTGADGQLHLYPRKDKR